MHAIAPERNGQTPGNGCRRKSQLCSHPGACPPALFCTPPRVFPRRSPCGAGIWKAGVGGERSQSRKCRVLARIVDRPLSRRLSPFPFIPPLSRALCSFARVRRACGRSGVGLRSAFKIPHSFSTSGIIQFGVYSSSFPTRAKKAEHRVSKLVHSIAAHSCRCTCALASMQIFSYISRARRPAMQYIDSYDTTCTRARHVWCARYNKYCSSRDRRRLGVGARAAAARGLRRCSYVQRQLREK